MLVSISFSMKAGFNWSRFGNQGWAKQATKLPSNRQSSPPVEFKGKTVIITGSGAGLGRAYALMFGKLGANLVINDLSKENAEKVVQEVKAGEINYAMFLWSILTPEYSWWSSRCCCLLGRGRRDYSESSCRRIWHSSCAGGQRRYPTRQGFCQYGWKDVGPSDSGPYARYLQGKYLTLLSSFGSWLKN